MVDEEDHQKPGTARALVALYDMHAESGSEVGSEAGEG